MNPPKAIAAFIANECDRARMSVPAWASTYRCGTDDVRSEWERQMSIKSQAPDNQYDVEGK